MGRQATYDRDKVLKSAMELFWARGFHNTSLKDLEGALDMRPGSIYAAFGSKEALFRAALDRYARDGRAGLDEIMNRAETPIAGLAAYVRLLGGITRRTIPSRACMLVKTLLEAPDDAPELRKSAEDMLRAAEATLAGAFRAARDSGEIAPNSDPDVLAAQLQAAIFGLRAYAQRSDAGDRVERIAEEIARDLEGLRV